MRDISLKEVIIRILYRWPLILFGTIISIIIMFWLYRADKPQVVNFESYYSNLTGEQKVAANLYKETKYKIDKYNDLMATLGSNDIELYGQENTYLCMADATSVEQLTQLYIDVVDDFAFGLDENYYILLDNTILDILIVGPDIEKNSEIMNQINNQISDYMSQLNEQGVDHEIILLKSKECSHDDIINLSIVKNIINEIRISEQELIRLQGLLPAECITMLENASQIQTKQITKMKAIIICLMTFCILCFFVLIEIVFKDKVSENYLPKTVNGINVLPYSRDKINEFKILKYNDVLTTRISEDLKLLYNKEKYSIIGIDVSKEEASQKFDIIKENIDYITDDIWQNVKEEKKIVVFAKIGEIRYSQIKDIVEKAKILDIEIIGLVLC